MELIWAIEHFCFSPRHKIQIWVHCCCIWFGVGLCIVRPSRQNPPRFRTATRWTLDAECWPAPPTGCPGPGSQLMSKMERDSRCTRPLPLCSADIPLFPGVIFHSRRSARMSPWSDVIAATQLLPLLPLACERQWLDPVWWKVSLCWEAVAAALSPL